MNKNMSLFKKISIFKDYRKSLKLCKNELEQKFGARVDNAWRIYNVINIPIESIGEPYLLKKSDIDKIAETTIREYTTELGKFLDSKGLQEMYDFYELSKVDKYSYLVVVGFSLPNSSFRSNVYYDNIRLKIIPATVGLSILIMLLIFLL